MGDQALLPGFIDAHGHFSAVSRYAALLDLSSPPVGGVTNIEDIVRALRLRIEAEQIPAGDLVYGFGYDDSLLAEGRHPNRDDLDRASTMEPPQNVEPKHSPEESQNAKFVFITGVLLRKNPVCALKVPIFIFRADARKLIHFFLA